jgi:hypothetical protein
MARWRSMQSTLIQELYSLTINKTLTQRSRRSRKSGTVPCCSHSHTAAAKSSGLKTGQACVRPTLPYAAVCGLACRPIEHKRSETSGLSPNCGKPGRPTATISVLAGHGKGYLSLHKVAAIECHAANEVSGGLVEGVVAVREEVTRDTVA